MEVRILIAVGAMVILALGVVSFVILYQRRQIGHGMEVRRLHEERRLALQEAAVMAEEAERQRIAQDLHDDVGALLATVRLFLHPVNGTASGEGSLTQARALLNEAMGKVREISHRLQPALLQRLGLELALESLVATLQQTGELDARFTPLAPLPNLPDATALALYRIVQELLANTIKHSGATALRIETGTVDTAWQVRLLHNGSGMTEVDFAERLRQPGAIGLKNIANRLELIRGHIQFSRIDSWAVTTVSGS